MLGTRALQGSVTTHPTITLTRTELKYGTSMKKAPYLHYGYPASRASKGGPKKNPPRPFLGIYDEDEKKIEQVLKGDILRAWTVGI